MKLRCRLANFRFTCDEQMLHSMKDSGWEKRVAMRRSHNMVAFTHNAHASDRVGQIQRQNIVD